MRHDYFSEELEDFNGLGNKESPCLIALKPMRSQTVMELVAKRLSKIPTRKVYAVSATVTKKYCSRKHTTAAQVCVAELWQE